MTGQLGSRLDEEAIRAALGATADGFNAHDAKRAAHAYMPDSHVAIEMSGLVAPDGQMSPSHQELNLRVFVREGGVWRVAALHNAVVARPGTVRRG